MTVLDSPAAKAGLVPGDRIVRIDDKPVEPLPLEECAKLLRGAAGSSVRLEVVPDGGDDSRNIAVRREKVVVSSAPVEAAHLIGGDIGYLRINSFNSHTPSETAAVLEKLRKEGMTRGLVIDLRNNPGGLVSGASETASLFLPEGAELFSARHRNTPEAQVVKAAAGAEKLLDLPIVILINPFTASAAELFSGAMQDHRRATLVGMKSFGKGTLLQVVPLANGGALQLCGRVLPALRKGRSSKARAPARYSGGARAAADLEAERPAGKASRHCPARREGRRARHPAGGGPRPIPRPE